MLSEWEDSQRSLGEFNFLLNAGLAAGVLFSGVLAGLGIKTAIVIFTLLAGLSCIFLLSRTRELLSSDRKKERFALSNSENSVKNALDTLFAFRTQKLPEKSQENHV